MGVGLHQQHKQTTLASVAVVKSRSTFAEATVDEIRRKTSRIPEKPVNPVIQKEPIHLRKRYSG